MLLPSDLCTGGGILHGGACMAIADTLAAVDTMPNLGPAQRTTTTDPSAKFIGAAKLGATVVGESVALHRARTTAAWQALIRHAEDKLCTMVMQTSQLIL